MPQVSKVTRKDVAQYAGVSETIVSYVMNDNRYVAEDKRQRVLEAVRVLNYHPNQNARALKGKPSTHIMFIADNLENEHFGHLVSEMDKCAYSKGYLISLTGNRNDADFIQQIISRQPDGVVISSTTLRYEYIQKLADNNIPVVLIGTRDYVDMDPRISVVYTGLYDGIRSAVKLLVDKGRKHLIHLDRISARGHFSSMQDLRYRGFCEQVMESGLTLTKDSIISGCYSSEELNDAIIARIRSGTPIDGIVARNDALASIALNAIRQCGLSVPDDIAVVGFDNSRISKITYPMLTTIEIDRHHVAEGIINLLYDMINGGESRHLHYQTILIERDST